MNQPLEEPERCPWCDGELEDGCCEGCDDEYAANDNWPDFLTFPPFSVG